MRQEPHLKPGRNSFFRVSEGTHARSMTGFLGYTLNYGISPNGQSQKIKFLQTFFSRQQPNCLNKTYAMTYNSFGTNILLCKNL